METIDLVCSANLQKDRIKKDRNALVAGQPPVYVGGRLLVSGLWSVVRKPNYVGDMIMALAYGLPSCGAYGLVPFAYFIYLASLLLHRASRDEERCRAKYGPVWEEYVSVVPYRFIPWIY